MQLADVYKGLTVKLGADTSSLSSALRKVRSEVSGVKTDLRLVEKALKLDPGNVKLLAQQQKDYQKAIGATVKELELLKEAEQKLAYEMTDGFIGPVNPDQQHEQWTKLQSDIVITEQRLTSYKQALTESMVQQKLADSTLNKAGKVVESFAAKLEPASRAMSQAGSTMTHTLTPAVVATGAAAFQLASDFETSMSQVAGALNDPNANMEELRQLALKTGEDTIFSATEAGNAMVELAKGGLTEADIKGGALATTMALAAAGNMNLADAANTVVQAMGAFGLSADQTGEAANALAGAAAASSADVSDLTQGLSQVSAQANSAGWSIQDTTAVLGAFADAGVTGSDAGTSLKTMLQRLAAPTDEAAGKMESLGINVRDGNGNMLDAAGVAQELTDKLGDLSSAEKDAAMQTIFGSDASRAALIMTNLGREGIEKYTAATNDQTAAQRLADSQMGESARAIEEMKGAVETAAIKIGTALAPTVTEIAGIVGDAAEAFSSMSEEEQHNVIQTAALVAGLGPALSILSKLIPVVGGVGRGIQGAAKLIAKLSTSAKDMAASTTLASAALGKLKSAIAKTGVGLLVVAVGAAVGKIMEFVDANAKAEERQRSVDEASQSLKSSLDGLQAGFDSAKSSASDYSVTADEIRAKADELTQAHKDLADSLNDSMNEAGSQAGMLESYMGVIEELGAKSGLTAGEQSRLQDALNKVNEACGTSFQLTNDANGALYGQVDAIRAVVSAQQDRLRYEAASEGLKDLYKQQEADLIEITRLEQERSDLIASKSGKTVAEQKKINDAITENYNALVDAREQYNATGETVSAYEKRIEELGAAIGSSSSEIAEWANSNAAVANALANTGQSVNDFASALEECGVSTYELSSLSEEQLTSLAQSYGGSIQSIVARLQEFGIVAGAEGSNAAAEYASGMSDGARQAVAAAAEMIGASVEQIQADCAYFGIEGDKAVTAYANALANGATKAEAAAAAAAASGALSAEQAEKYNASGQASGNAYASSLAASKDLAVASALEVTGMTLEQFNAAAAQAGIEGDEAVAAFANQLAAGVTKTNEAGIINADAATNALGTADGLTPGTNTGSDFALGVGWQSQNAHVQGVLVAGSATSGLGTSNGTAPGSALGGQFASGVGSRSGNARASGTTIANSAGSGMQSQNGNAGGWGSHLAENFAAGIRGAIDWVSNAATSLADAVKSILGHTVPKEGPLRNGGKGEAEWGAHVVQNFAYGVESQIPALKKTMTQVSGAVAEALESPVTLGANITVNASVGKAASRGVNVTVEQTGGITEESVYNAVNAALSRQDGRPIIITVKADDREIARVVRKYA
jgi:TP901 family phage tail tape measure protein|nr:MAG TPA: minor tail protein [Caudoviricetes sp.]